jgi:hypothetical protein
MDTLPLTLTLIPAANPASCGGHINSKFQKNVIINSEGVECKINVRCSLSGALEAHRRIVLASQIVKIQSVVGQAINNSSTTPKELNVKSM